MSIMNSVNTNIGAQIALQNMNATNKALDQVQNRISTGMRVASAQDDGASFAIAQGLRSDIKAVGAVNEQLNKAKGLLAVTIAGMTDISDALADVRSVLTKLADQNVEGETREQYEADFRSLASEIVAKIHGSTYNGSNLLRREWDGAAYAAPMSISVISDIQGGQYEITGQDVERAMWDLAEVFTAAIVDSPAVFATEIETANVTAGLAQGLIAGGSPEFDDLVSAVNDALNKFAADDRRITGQIEFNSKLNDAIEIGLGATVDADLAKESARLQALQIKQQLGSQALGIANQSPQILLGLFGR